MKTGRPTTAKGPGDRTAFRRDRPLQAIAAGFAAVWIASAIAPHDRFDWLLENLLVLLWLGVLISSYRSFRLSNRAYLLIGLFLTLHTVGSHYTYSLTPAGFWLQAALDLERNHYDRIVHFCFGLLMFSPIREILVRRAGACGRWRLVLPLAMILALGSFYELLEWGAAQVISPEAALAFLGTQGDVFDAQKDTLLAALGGALALALTALSPAPIDR